MEFEFPADAEAFRTELREFMREELPSWWTQMFADDERAFALYEDVRAQDIDVRVVRVDGSQFTHVRVGRFAERAAAVELLEELTARGISAALVRDDRPERPAGN